MRLKSFHGPSLTEAMRLVRDALGENAIIVATRDDEAGGVRVTAAIDDITTSTPSTTQPPEPPEGSEAIEIIAEALTRHQVPNHLAERLLATATQFANDDPVLALGAAFDAHFQFQPIIDDKMDKPLVLVGPPGAGKTLCTAKFATKSTMSKRAVTVITTDVERAGGMEQLAAFTRLLKLNLIEIEDSHALRDAIGLQRGSNVFVDTAGRNPFNDLERQQLNALILAAGGDATLVLPAGMDAVEATDMAHEFRNVGASRILFTRIDMVKRLGSLLRIAFDAHLPLANYSASAKVTEPPLPFNPVALARLILPRNVKTETKATGTHS
ncbi:MAG: GTPase [Alphaproteobacteria bacterium]